MLASFCGLPSLSPISTSKLIISNQPYLSMVDKYCTTMRDLQQFHAHLIKSGQAIDSFAASRILAFCASPLGNMDYAYLVFLQMQNPNLFSWNTVIRGFSQSSNPQIALSLFIDMLVSSQVEPQRLTYPSIFKAYSQLGLAYDGAQLHGRIIKLGLQFDPFIRNTILYMYATGGFLSEARRIFNQEMEFDVVSWNSMILGLAKCGEIDESRKLFDKMPVKNSISWNSMIGGYVRNGMFKEALKLFIKMQEERIQPSEFTMVSLLNASAQIGALRQGEWIHEYIKKNNLQLNAIVVTAIIDMYCKCGSIGNALQVFEKIPNRGLSSWNSMIFGLAVNGCEKEAILLFKMLESSSLKPDSISFMAVLTACNHGAMVDEGMRFFSRMKNTYRIEPSIKHYNLMVDMISRGGFLEEAEQFIKTMPMEGDAIIWGCLLSACRIYGNTEMAKRAAEKVNELDPEETMGYVLMANIHAWRNNFVGAMEKRVAMRMKKVEKEPGGSLIEVDDEVHEFIAAGGRLHRKAQEIYLVLDQLGVMLQDKGAFGEEFEINECGD
ncbi:pentatricopeptide repeat-containing protein [Cucumis melo var. makuwa]|uniref:Pentatricopeptide repeat-containing protein n=1 Tax=Cucumis melo var. makuwa TaxID=1194695 RepID=A0A5A7SN44_CUCMM|nr:pentatricopeptide repeat-containing protein [Cucumis melo var. makuwa]TYK17761.1 pentatricopeptide repeat-containing protein [Cucumis melo var. makuwa]